jgi:hypothetical protein
MTLINSSLLIGLLLAAVPVILHMVMRAKPKRIEFPALRLLKSRQPSNARRMQLRHWLLLFLRALLIAVLVLAIARPSLPAARYGLQPWEWLALALAVGGAVGTYFWLTRKSNPLSLSVDTRERHGKLRMWCVLGGFLAALTGVGVPWGLRVRAELSSPRPEATENIPVAAIFILDTSYSMKYRHENKTRLEYARDAVKEHLGRLPQGSRAAISGIAADEDIIFQADLAGAGGRLDTLEPTAVPDSLNRRIKAAMQAQIDDRKRVQEDAGTGGSADLFAREIYVFSDFSKVAWQEPDESGIADLLTQLDWLQVYLVDVSVTQPINTAVSRLRLSEQTTVAGRDLVLSMNVVSTVGTVGTPTVETWLIDQSGVAARFGAPQIVNLQNGTAQVQTVVRASSEQKFMEGLVRLTSEDPLADDNVRYFSCGIRPRPRLLLVSDRVEESQYFKHVFVPTELEMLGTASCECISVATAQVSQQSLSNFDAVFLVNCARPEESFWNELKRFTESGGGVFIVAGSDRIDPFAWNVDSAKALLPAVPIRTVPFRNEPGRLRIADPQHPIMKEFVNLDGASAELGAVVFDRRWAVELAADASVLMAYMGEKDLPALIERNVGKGRCLLFTSAMDNLSDGGSKWNNFVTSWSFVMLADKLLQHVTGANDLKRNFQAGEAVELPVPVSQRFEQFLLLRPGGRQTRDTLPVDQSSVLLTDAVDPGHYLLKPFESRSPYQAAFAVNFDDEETDLTRITDESLFQMLGKERVSIVHNVSELQRAVRAGRLGVELFPFLMGLLILVFCAEHLMANFFYDEQPVAKPSAA